MPQIKLTQSAVDKVCSPIAGIGSGPPLSVYFQPFDPDTLYVLFVFFCVREWCDWFICTYVDDEMQTLCAKEREACD